MLSSTAMLKTNIKILLFIVITLLLFGCGKTLPGSKTIESSAAYVCEKIIKPPYSVEVDDSTTIDMGDGLSMTIPGTRTIHYPESYWVKVYYRNENDEICYVVYEVQKDFYTSLQMEQQVYIERYRIANEKEE